MPKEVKYQGFRKRLDQALLHTDEGDAWEGQGKERDMARNQNKSSQR
jgi:hypothetical protein